MARVLRAALLAWAVLTVAAPVPAAELFGTWYVLIHYKDSSTAKPETERWEDRIWILQPEGSRLRWTEFPIVVFDSRDGRFERTSRQYARTLHYWEPNERQLKEIASGLQVNERGKRDKTLRGDATSGWRSVSQSRGFSANTLTFTTNWFIDDPGGLPEFRIEESLGGARAESLDGLTRYRAAEIGPDGVLRGEYHRDDTRVGTFRAFPAGAVRTVEGGKTQQEIRSNLGRQTGAGAGADSAAEAEVRKGVEEAMRAEGMDPQDHPEEVEAKVREILQMLREGRAPPSR